jgi:hypothetical protein
MNVINYQHRRVFSDAGDVSRTHGHKFPALRMAMPFTKPFCVAEFARFEPIAIIDDQQFSLLCAAPDRSLKGDAKTIFKSLRDRHKSKSLTASSMES